MSRFLARASNSKFSHTGIVAIEVEGPVVYDMTRTGRVSATVLCLGSITSARSGSSDCVPEYKKAIPKVLAYCRTKFDEKVPFDYQLSEDDDALYCIEMTEKAYRSAGIELSRPIRLGDMERASEFPFQMFGLRFASRYALDRPLSFDQLVFFPGNDNHGIWSARQLMTVVPPTYAPGHPDYNTAVTNGTSPRESGAPSAKKISSPGTTNRGAAARIDRSGT